MSANTADLKTLAIVLRRTNYGEADRILNLITPTGKISAIARSVRKARSRLAGGVEMFTLAEITIHRGRSDLGIITSARMVTHYSHILRDYDRLEFAGEILRQINRAAEGSDGPEWFEITRQSLAGLDTDLPLQLIQSWFWLNLAQASGEEMNLYRDDTGAALQPDVRYDWDSASGSFTQSSTGDYSTNELKLLRLMSRADLTTISRIKINPSIINKIYAIIKEGF